MADTAYASRPAPCQVRPSGLTATPAAVAAPIPSSPNARARTSRLARPDDAGVHVVPPSLLAYTPWPLVPMNASMGLRTSNPAAHTRGPASVRVQVIPASVLVYTPASVPASMVAGFTGSSAMLQMRPLPSWGSLAATLKPAAPLTPRGRSAT